ncbi:MAG: putative T-complex protein 1 subunit alpha, partial [Streblomastix strix]
SFQVEITKASELEAVREREIEEVHNRINLILKAGANVILCSGGIDDLCLKYLIESNTIGVRRVRRSELDQIAKATGGSVVTSLGNLEGKEEYEQSNLGYAEEVAEERIADDEALFIKKPKSTQAVSILLRGPSDYALDEMERSLNDSIHSLQSTLESDGIVVGGGAVDVAVNVAIEEWARTMGGSSGEGASREQLAAELWASSLLTIPKTLALNAAKDATELIAQLRAVHSKSQKEEGFQDLRFYGLDLINGK